MMDTKAVDFDATIAEYDVGGPFVETLGAPIEMMVRRVKAWLAQDIEVVILTARVHPCHGEESAERFKEQIREWCRINVGRELEVTHEKHPRFSEIWDDKAISVIPNTGLRVDGVEDVPVESDSIGVFLDG